MEEKNIKITINVECSEKSSVKKEQIAGYLLRAIAGVTANNKCLITNYVCEINEKNDDKLQEKYITGKPKLTKGEKSFLDGLDPSWSYMLRNGKGQLYLPCHLPGQRKGSGSAGPASRLNKKSMQKGTFCAKVPFLYGHFKHELEKSACPARSPGGPAPCRSRS